jgi:hypothetical protein
MLANTNRRNQRLIILAVVLLASAFASAQKPQAEQAREFRPGAKWLDTDGNPIEAHAGGIINVNGTFYWYGENHRLGLGNKTGVSVYSSRDLYQWKNEGVALPKAALPEQFRDTGVCERPKVLYNASTRKFVMWMHLDTVDYTAASAGVATSDSPTGPFTFLGYSRPIKYDYGIAAPDRAHEKELGNTFRDMNLFADDDGSAYVIYASEENATTYIARLNDSYTAIVTPAVEGKTWARVLPKASREGAALFKFKGHYYMFSSGTTGWSPNPADLATAEHIFGPWESLGNPCSGADENTTYGSQSTFVLPAPGKGDDAFIFMGDRWVGHKLKDSTHVWLPFVVRPDGTVSLEFLNKWNMAVFDSKPKSLSTPVAIQLPAKGGPPRLQWKAVDGADHYIIYRDSKVAGSTSELRFTVPEQLGGRVFDYCVAAANIRGAHSSCSRQLKIAHNQVRSVFLSDIEPDSWHQGFGSLQHDKGIDGGPIRIAGKVFQKGLGTHAVSEIIYYLGGLGGYYSRFQAWVGVDNALKAEFPFKPSSVEFKVYVDGRLVYESGVMVGDTPAKFVDLSLVGAKELKLFVSDAGDGTHYDHADWADAKLLP